MIVACNHCGKQYKVDLGKMKTDTGQLRCIGCQNIFTISKPQAPMPPAAASPGPKQREATTLTKYPPRDVAAPATKRFVSLRTKMMVLFCFIPIAILFISGILYLKQLDYLAGLLNQDSSHIVRQLAENIVKERARSVSSQTQAFLLNRSQTSLQNLLRDDAFLRTVMQKVGLTGYTALYVNSGNGDPITLLVHPNNDFNGRPFAEVMGSQLGDAFDAFKRVLIKAEKGLQIESSGYYTQADKHQRVRKKFMVLSPVLGTHYGIAVVTHLDELTREITRLSQRADKITISTRNIVFLILGSSLLLISLVVLAYGQNLAGRVQSLTKLSEQISLGNLDTRIEVKTQDEIGLLAEAISRMQDSIRLSIDRLRRRR